MDAPAAFVLFGAGPIPIAINILLSSSDRATASIGVLSDFVEVQDSRCSMASRDCSLDLHGGYESDLNAYNKIFEADISHPGLLDLNLLHVVRPGSDLQHPRTTHHGRFAQIHGGTALHRLCLSCFRDAAKRECHRRRSQRAAVTAIVDSDITTPSNNSCIRGDGPLRVRRSIPVHQQWFPTKPKSKSWSVHVLIECPVPSAA